MFFGGKLRRICAVDLSEFLPSARDLYAFENDVSNMKVVIIINDNRTEWSPMWSVMK